MKLLTRKSDITINSRKMRVGELITNLKSLPSVEVRDFFIKQKKMIPRAVRCEVLRTIIDIQLKEKKVAASLTDEMNYRLNWYSKFSEYQLENLLAFFNNQGLVDQFKEELWLAIVSRHDDLQIDDITLFTLYQKSINFRIESENTEGLMEYNRVMDCIFYDEDGCIDGLSLVDFREVLLQSSTLVELREIGTKYGIDVPRRIKKNELMDIILDELKEQGRYTAEIDEKVRKMSVVGLQRFAKDNNIKASIELKKEDIIEYIIKFMSIAEVPGGEKVVLSDSVSASEQIDDEEIGEEIVEDKKEEIEVDFNNLDLADLFAPETEAPKTKNPDVIVPDSAPKEDVVETEMFEEDPMLVGDMPDMGMDIDPSMMEPSVDKPSEHAETFEQTTEEGTDAMAGFDMSDLDIIMPEDTNGADSIFQFEDAKYEEPTVSTKPTNNNMFDDTTPSDSSAQMGGFKSELNEFNRKLESLLAFQMKMLEKNNQASSTPTEKKVEKPSEDLFATVAAEVKQEKIEQARGLDEIRKLAAEGKDTGYKTSSSKISTEQGSYLQKREAEKESKKRIKERERAKKLMSPEELEIVLEQEAREKEQLKRQRDAEKAMLEAGGKRPMGPAMKIFISLVIVGIIVLAFLTVVYFVCHEGIVEEGFIRDIYDLCKKLLGRA